MTRRSSTSPTLPVEPELPPSGIQVSPTVLNLLTANQIGPTEALFLGYYETICNAYPKWTACWVSKSHLAKLFNLTVRRVQGVLTSLYNQDFLTLLDHAHNMENGSGPRNLAAPLWTVTAWGANHGR